jgi:hypothetical protein
MNLKFILLLLYNKIMPYYQSLGDIYFFAVYDQVSNQLLYTKYNFIFENYKKDFLPSIDITDKSSIFHDFLIRNESSLDKPFSLKENLIKYFSPITDEIINYFNIYGYCFNPNYMTVDWPSTYISVDQLIKDQFDMILYTDDQIRRVQDYILIDNKNVYSKYNFDFTTYSNDWHVWGNKLVIFTDFTARCVYLNNIIVQAYGYGFPPTNFQKYFIQEPNLKLYLNNYSVSSVYKNVDKSYYSIDFIKYGMLNTDLNTLNNDIALLKNHYLQYGQFEKRVVPFINNSIPINDINQKLVTINSNGVSASGFLFAGSNEYRSFNGSTNLYLVTCYHLIQSNSNKNVFKAAIIINNANGNYGQTITRILEFKIIGYEIYADICVAAYDPTTDYNTIFNSDLDISIIPTLEILLDAIVNRGEIVSIVGNLSNDNSLVFMQGPIMDKKHVGSFRTNFVLGMPDSLQLDIRPTPGMSGSPVLRGDISKGEKLYCIGMINSSCGYKEQYTLAINGFYLNTIVSNIIGNWFVYRPLFNDNIIRYNFLIKDGYPKRWLGISATYYNLTLSPKKSSVFSNFPYNGGIVIHDFILGFNYLTGKFIYEVLDLSKQGVISLRTPLLDSKMYNKFISHSKTPIVIKSISMLDNIHNQYAKFYVGNYGNQVPYNIITYTMAQIGTTYNDAKYTNRVKRLYQPIEIEYYYFNGLQWVIDVETIGGTTDDWFIDTTDNIGNLFHQHRFDFPTILIPYIDVYHNESIKDAPLLPLGQTVKINLGNHQFTIPINNLDNEAPDSLDNEAPDSLDNEAPDSLDNEAPDGW